MNAAIFTASASLAQSESQSWLTNLCRNHFILKWITWNRYEIHVKSYFVSCTSTIFTSIQSYFNRFQSIHFFACDATVSGVPLPVTWWPHLYRKRSGWVGSRGAWTRGGRRGSRGWPWPPHAPSSTGRSSHRAFPPVASQASRCQKWKCWQRPKKWRHRRSQNSHLRAPKDSNQFPARPSPICPSSLASWSTSIRSIPPAPPSEKQPRWLFGEGLGHKSSPQCGSQVAVLPVLQVQWYTLGDRRQLWLWPAMI